MATFNTATIEAVLQELTLTTISYHLRKSTISSVARTHVSMEVHAGTSVHQVHMNAAAHQATVEHFVNLLVEGWLSTPTMGMTYLTVMEKTMPVIPTSISLPMIRMVIPSMYEQTP